MRLVPLKFFTAEIKEFIHSKVLHGFPPPSNPQFNILLKYQSLMIHSSELKKKRNLNFVFGFKYKQNKKTQLMMAEG